VIEIIRLWKTNENKTMNVTSIHIISVKISDQQQNRVGCTCLHMLQAAEQQHKRFSQENNLLYMGFITQ